MTWSRFMNRGSRQQNDGKDAAITWRHLAHQTSGYGLAEKPGEAYSYNDCALALYYDTLMRKGLSSRRDRAFSKCDWPSRWGSKTATRSRHSAQKDRPGRLAVSVRDLARFGLLYLRGGKWREQATLEAGTSLKLAIDSPLAADTPLTCGQRNCDAPRPAVARRHAKHYARRSRLLQLQLVAQSARQRGPAVVRRRSAGRICRQRAWRPASTVDYSLARSNRLRGTTRRSTITTTRRGMRKVRTTRRQG